MLQPAMERIALQLNSPLAKQLVALCDAFLTWVEATRQPLIVDGKIPRATEDRIRQVMDYTKDVFAPGLVKICAQQLNFTTMIYTDRTIDYGNSAMYPCYVDIMKTKDVERLIVGRAIYSGIESHTNTTFDPDIFTQLSATIDLEKSKLIKKTTDYVFICWILPTTFLGPELFSGPAFYTAEEHAAIFLHEIGHALSILEHMGELYHRADVATNSIRYFTDKATDKESGQVVNTLEKLSSKLPPDYQTALVAVKTNVSRFHPVIAGLVFFYLVFVFLKYIKRFMDAGVISQINDGTQKTSDTVVTHSNRSYDERIADEFVSRHGLGAALTAALLKSGGYIRTSFNEAVNNNLIAKATLFSLSIGVHFFGMFLFCGDDGTYDPLWLRIEHILQNNMVIFKDEKLSPEVRSHFLDETKALLELYDSYKKSTKFKLQQLFWGTITRITSRSSVLDGFRTANLSNDYDQLQLMTNKLVKNSLYRQAARLKNL